MPGRTEFEWFTDWVHQRLSLTLTVTTSSSSDGVLAERLVNGRHRLLSGMAHLPQLEDPAAVGGVILDALVTA